MSDVTMLGAGQMGAGIADLLLRTGRSVTVWNRTPHRTAPLAERGAAVADSPAAAIAASPVSIIVVHDDEASEAVLTAEGVAEALKDRLLINFGTSGPDAARRFAALVDAVGGRFLDGAIQTSPSLLGREDTPIFVSGPRPTFVALEDLLRTLGGNLTYLGEAVDAAAFTDLSTLSHVYGAYAGFLHGALIAERVGVDVKTYGKLVQDLSPTFGAFFAHEGGVIQSGDFTVSESPLRISIPAVERILRISRELGLNDEVPTVLDGWLKEAERRGFAGEELAALIKVLRR